MAYSDFSLQKIKTEFNLIIDESVDLFSDVQAIAPSNHLSFTLSEAVLLVSAINTEKIRSELLIAPILMDVRRHLNYQISLFSGIDFNVAPEKGLAGFCDFILSRSTEQYFLTSPVVTIVEAKNESIKSGLGQCIAEMIAAQLFNKQNSEEPRTLYGAVTTGQIWKFLKIENQTVFIDKVDYYVSNVAKILGIFVAIFQDE